MYKVMRKVVKDYCSRLYGGWVSHNKNEMESSAGYEVKEVVCVTVVCKGGIIETFWLNY